MSSLPEVIRRVAGLPDSQPNHDLVEALYMREIEMYRREMTREEGFIPLTEERVRQLDYFFGKGDLAYRKMIYGHYPIVELVQEGEGGQPAIKLAERSYHEATWGPIADSIALETRALLAKTGVAEDNPGILELNTGAGSITYSLHHSGFHIPHTVERNYTIHIWARQNLERLGVDGNIGFVIADAWDFVDDLSRHGARFDVAIADPPWGRFHFHPGSRFRFADMKPDGRKIVPHLMKVAPVVGLKTPASLQIAEIEHLADSLHAGLFLLGHRLHIGGMVFEENFALYLREDLGITSKAHKIVDIGLEHS